jgi:hypothetical protein
MQDRAYGIIGQEKLTLKYCDYNPIDFCFNFYHPQYPRYEMRGLRCLSRKAPVGLSGC